MDEDKRHKETLKILKQSTNLTKWFLIATVLLALTSIISIMKEWGVSKDTLDVVYIFIIFIGIAVLIKVFILIFKKE